MEEPTDEAFVAATKAYAKCLNKGQEARLSQQDLLRLSNLAEKTLNIKEN